MRDSRFLRARPWTVLMALVLVACSKPAPPTEPLRAVRTALVAERSGDAVLEYAAEVRPRVESRLAFRVPGKLLRRAVNLGDSVRPGQLLAQIDPADLRLAQEAAQAAVQSAQVNLEQTSADFKRYQELRAQGFISAAELERRENIWKAAQAQLAQARAQSAVQANQAGYARLLADAPGVVTGVDAEPGMVLGAGTPVMRVAHDGPRDVVFSVPEDRAEDARRWLGKPGMLSVRIWGDGRDGLPATVREVAAAADSVARTFLVKADLGKANARIGQTATVRVTLPGEPGAAAIVVPLGAVSEKDGRAVVWVLDGASMTVRPRPVTLAGSRAGQWYVSAGLEPGLEIVTAGLHVLTPGQRVRRYGPAEGGAGGPVASPPAPAASR